ncbi:MAG: DUF3313 domain-containing protein [Proteobacteria bacterium]|nr:DUF3313 domain-containing protein [Pseudomonadota bacterium]
MHTIKKAIFGMVIFVLVLPSSAWAGKWPQCSGFLSECKGFTPDPDRSGVFVYTASNFHPRNYSRFMFTPIEIWIDPDSEYKGVQPDQLKKITDHFLEVMTDALKDGYPIVDKPGPGVAIVRIALTNVYLKKKKWKARNFLPIGAVSKGVQKAAGKNIALTTAHLEMEMLDSQSGERLKAGVDMQVGEKLREKIKKGKKRPETTWADVEKTLEFYAKRFRQRMDAARGK